MRALEIHLKSGTAFEVAAIEVKSTIGSHLSWTSPNGARRRLLDIVPSEIVALVVIQ